MKRYKNGFTLVEMLIAMLLFAIIAVMLIPNVMQNAEKNLFITQTKKVYNDVQQAFLWIVSENQGSMKTACSGIADGRQCIRNLLAGTTTPTKIPKKLESYCSFGHAENTDNNRKDASNPAKQDAIYRARNPQLLNGRSANNAFVSNMTAYNKDSYYAVYLKNGAYVSAVFDGTCNTNPTTYLKDGQKNLQVCGYVEIDVNGGKVPNIVGKDIHYFWITEKDGLVPFGEMDGLACGTLNANNIDFSAIPENDTTKTDTQLGCTARLINIGKIDYY